MVDTPRIDLYRLGQHFDDINARYFEGFLELPALRWNTRLRSSAGRFIPGSRTFSYFREPTIEIASYLVMYPDVDELIRDTMAHEMIHYWLWLRHQPYGHTPEFYAKMEEMGVNRYNPVPLQRPYRYVYRCPACDKYFRARRKLGPLACKRCCQTLAGGRYDERFALVLEHELVQPRTRKDNSLRRKFSQKPGQPFSRPPVC